MIHREIFLNLFLVPRQACQQIVKVIGPFGLTRPERMAMEFINNSGTCTLVEIARYLSIKKPSVTMTINELEQKGLVEQIPGKDRREKRIRLTDKGGEVFLAYRDALDEVEQHLLKGLSDEELRVLLHSLLTIGSNSRHLQDHPRRVD
jgi:DNA-binding MarR family transcriptional regulator